MMMLAGVVCQARVAAGVVAAMLEADRRVEEDVLGLLLPVIVEVPGVIIADVGVVIADE